MLQIIVRKVSSLNLLLPASKLALHGRFCSGHTVKLLPARITLSRKLSNSQVVLSQQNQVSEDVRQQENMLTTAEKVKQVGKDASWMSVLVVGFVVAGALIWYVANELLFGFSSTNVYSKALKIVKNDSKVKFAIGDNMKGYGEETARGRRRHVSFQEYIVDGVNHMRVQFYVSGSKQKATVHAEARETTRGNFEFRYIFLELQTYPPVKPIIVVDNR